MPKHLNKIDHIQRLKIISSIFDEGKSVSETARRFGFPLTTVYHIAKIFDEEGRTDKKQRGGNRHKVLQEEHIKWIREQLDLHPGLTIQDLHKALNQHFNSSPPISLSAVSRAVRLEAGYSLKLLRYEPEDYNSPARINARATWTQNFLELGFSMMDCVFVDESGFNLHLTRRFGRSPKGKRASQVRPTQRGRNVSLVAAVGREGIIASEVMLGAFNSEKYEAFFANKLLGALKGPRTIIMDNVPFHRTNAVRDLIQAKGYTCLHLPPYTPHLNAAEWVFSNVKAHVKKQDLKDRETLTEHINNGLHRITPDMCIGWMREVNRNFGRANRGEPLGRLYT